jgi:hypothetical protein
MQELNNGIFFLDKYHCFSPKDNDVILSIVKVLIAKHLDASDTLNYEMLLKEKIKRLYTAFTSDYQLHI